ncbi:MAG: hypothetical protein AAFY59_00815 [Pseudomonadota bacterium]
MELNTLYLVLLPICLAYQSWFLCTTVARMFSGPRPTVVEAIRGLPKLNMQLSLAVATLPVMLHTLLVLSFGQSIARADAAAPFSTFLYYALPSILLYVVCSGFGMDWKRAFQKSSAPA